MKFRLCGYFDNNFGDDYMMKIIVQSLPDFEFVVDDEKFVNNTILDEKNVSFSRQGDEKYPALIVTGSGFMVNSRAALKSELKSFLKGRSPGDFCLGCNIEPIRGVVAKLLIRHKLNKFKMIVCRDKKSFLWFLKNVKKPEIRYLPDIVFGIPDEWLPENNEGTKLGISLMHRSGDTANCEYYRKMAEIADFWIEKTGEDVILMAFDSGTEDDVFSCECVKNLTRNPKKVRIAVHRQGNEIIEAFSECRKIVGARFHSGVLALRMRIPFYPLIYREKMWNMLEDSGYPLMGCRVDECDVERVKEFLVSDDMEFRLSEMIINKAGEYAKVFRSFVMGKI